MVELNLFVICLHHPDFYCFNRLQMCYLKHTKYFQPIQWSDSFLLQALNRKSILLKLLN